MRSAAAVLLLVPSLVSAGPVPAYPGLSCIWQDTFSGSAGAPPSDLWNIAVDVHANNEAQLYTTSNNNIQISGGGTIQFVPRKSSSGQWTSGRIESRGTFMPQPGKVTQVEAALRVGNNPQANKQGMWPAFWLLGDSFRHGTSWPQCGELDIFEQVNGALTGYGTTHCGSYPGGVCNEPTGKGASVSIPDDDFHVWTLKIDRTARDWTGETITWLRDGAAYHSLTGAQLGDQAVWSTLAHSPQYIILNLAVGGDWPGAPNGATLDGYGSMFEVEYVAVYSS